MIKYGHNQDVPVADRGRPVDELFRPGVLVQEFQLRLRHDALGEAAYRISTSKEMVKVAGDPSLPPRIELKPGYDPSDHTLSMSLEFPLPEIFAEKRQVNVMARVLSRVNAADSAYFGKMSALTHNFQIAYSFDPPVHVGVVKYRWRRAEERPEEKEPPGVAWIQGWLVPGNGICVTWNGLSTH